MTTDTIQHKLFALYRLTSEQLADLFTSGNFDEFSIKYNEFEVFCAFWVTTCYLRSTEVPVQTEVEGFNKSIIVSIVDKIIERHPGDMEEERLASLSETVTDIFVERFTGYRKLFQDDTSKLEQGGSHLFPRLVESFLSSTLDKPVDESSPVRQLLDASLWNLLKKSGAFFDS